MFVFSSTAWAGGRVVAWGSKAPATALKQNMAAVSAGFEHSLALSTSGVIVAWGDNSLAQTVIPKKVQNNVVQISAGGFHSLALKKNGEVVAWGDNSDKQVKLPPGVDRSLSFKAVAAGMFHSLALNKSGKVFAWGYNEFGQTFTPLGLTDAIAISAGAVHSMALRANGEVLVWGSSDFGVQNLPARVSSGIKAISAGYFHNLALTTNGEVIAWGDNSFGQCNVPADAKFGIVSISAGQMHSMAIKADGSLITWGGSIGGPEASEPTTKPHLSAVSAGGYHSLGLIPSTADDNHNGIPDWWEIMHDLVGSDGDLSDSDGDGVSDLQEYLSDTNPMDANSNFSISMKMSNIGPGTEIVYGPLSIERRYTLESCTDLCGNGWKPVTGQVNIQARSTLTEGVMAIPVESNARIYRISVSVP